jgi:hypothetical protein
MLQATKTGYTWSPVATHYMKELDTKSIATKPVGATETVGCVYAYHQKRFTEMMGLLADLGTLQKEKCPVFKKNYFLVVEAGYKTDESLSIEDWVKKSVNIKFGTTQSAPHQNFLHRQSRISATCPLRMIRTGTLYNNKGDLLSMLCSSTGFVIGNNAENKAGFSVKNPSSSGTDRFSNEALLKDYYDCPLTKMCTHQSTCEQQNLSKQEAIFFTDETAAKKAYAYSGHQYPEEEGVITADNVIGVLINADECLKKQLNKLCGVNELRRGLHQMCTSLAGLNSSKTPPPCYVYDRFTNRMYELIPKAFVRDEIRREDEKERDTLKVEKLHTINQVRVIEINIQVQGNANNAQPQIDMNGIYTFCNEDEIVSESPVWKKQGGDLTLDPVVLSFGTIKIRWNIRNQSNPDVNLAYWFSDNIDVPPLPIPISEDSVTYDGHYRPNPSRNETAKITINIINKTPTGGQ